MKRCSLCLVVLGAATLFASPAKGGTVVSDAVFVDARDLPLGWQLAGVVAVPPRQRTKPRLLPRSASAEEWPGWRGLSLEGRVPSPTVPISWSKTHNIRWKTSLPGSGYSSPVVSNNSVYVTTAYASQESGKRRQAMGYLVFILSLGITFSAIRFIIHSCHQSNDMHENTARLVSVTTFTLILTISILLIHFGEHFCVFRRCNVRSWIGSAVISTLCLILAAHRLKNRKARIILGGAAVLFGGFVLIWFPSKDHVYREGILGLSARVAQIPSIFPVIVGTFLLVTGFSARTKPFQDPAHVREKKIWIPSMLMFGFITASAFVALGTAHLVFQLITPDSTAEVDDVRYQSKLGWWAFLFSGGFFGFCALIRFLRGTALTRIGLVLNLAFISSTALFILTAGLTLLEKLVENSSYLTYHVGTPELRPYTGWLLFGVFVAVCISFIALLSIRTKLSTQNQVPRISILFRFGAVALAVITFVHANCFLPSETFVRAIVCLDRADGAITWICEGLPGSIGRLDRHNSPATPTAIIYGKYVFGYFGTAGLLCCDLKGNLIWTNKALPYESVYGAGGSPTISDGILVVVSDMPEGSSHIWALNCKTGKLLWTQQWEVTGGISGNSRTPLVRYINGEKVIIVWGRNYVRAYDLLSGREAWFYSFEPRGQDLVASMVSDDDRIYLSDATGTMALDQAKLGTTMDPLLWKSKKRGANCSSPVLGNGLLFFITDTGIAHCLDSHTGEILWRERLNGKYYASLIANRERVYFTNTVGVTTVVANEKEFRQLAENDLAEDTFASPAPVDRELFIRTTENLYCIRAP
jgi:outer membrane protein assembly factor BamB